MKNLHFYIQSIMVLMALGLAVQIPSHRYLIGYVVFIEFVLGVYQMGMSFMLLRRLSKKTQLLQLHFLSSWVYLLGLIGLAALDPEWMDDWWKFAVFGFPWALAILFLVTMDELERTRHYRL